MKPFVENSKAVFDDRIDFSDLYKNLVPFYKKQRREAANRVIAGIDTIKEAMRETGLDDDDMLEIFLVLLSIAMEVDTAMYIGKRLLREYFEDPEKPKTEKPKAEKAKAEKSKTEKPKTDKRKAEKSAKTPRP
jgi:hypothetical protein